MNEPFKQSDESFLHIENWQTLNPNLIAGFTTRNGGVSNSPFQTLNLGLHVADEKDLVIENRETLANKLDVSLRNWVSGEQVHQANIAIIKDKDKGKGSVDYNGSIKGTDGLITNKKDVLLTAFYADCVPLFFFDPVSGYIGIAHAGWKGTVSRIAEKMVQAFQNVGVMPENLFIVIGPCISQSVYEVDHNVVGHNDDEMRQRVTIQQKNNRYLLDLKQLNVEILLQSGVLRHNIEVTNYCTYNDEELFFSHRRDKGRTGRMLGFLGFKK
ncbi:peptidoglycan editing factor PgeF [Oceanobacillus bengalensis]|uniref:Purine nucleoside phosphorylase n=1 Tax=Oceanobacillus bengalensis TaxID=1435466 RepID=A0A494Z1B8_9BACI|nr:peptidoglycan editing factor PgeF [Oceanobacillus bengalensis]RKQ16297.1 peptidoglycan editing factor PgeF [Oceanobacillus bengalensis]